jgi:4-carboxymuconolactone decarboxylase
MGYAEAGAAPHWAATARFCQPMDSQENMMSDENTGRAVSERAGDVFRSLAAEGDTPPWEAVAQVAPALGAHIKHGLGILVGDPALDLRTRELITVAVLAALGSCEPQLAFHTAGALRAGATETEIVETVTQVALYAGIPRTLNALAVAREALAGLHAGV